MYPVVKAQSFFAVVTVGNEAKILSPEVLPILEPVSAKTLQAELVEVPFARDQHGGTAVPVLAVPPVAT